MYCNKENMKKRFLRLSSIVFVIFILASCNDYFEDVNTNKDDPQEVSYANILTGGITNVMDSYGEGFDRYAGTFTQHFAGNHATGVDMDQYNLESIDFEGFFTTMYSDAFIDLDMLITQASEDGADHYVGIAKIVTALGLGYLTDVYGNIPWSEALNVLEETEPAYDSQEEIYNTIQQYLTEGISDLSSSSNSNFVVGTEDLIFSGDTKKWIAMAYVLKARYYNHLSKRSPTTSANQALQSIDMAIAAELKSDGSGDIQYTYDGSAVHLNPWYELFENNLIIASENFMNLLISTKDPRIVAYWDDISVDDTYVGRWGKPNGFGADNRSFSPVGPDGFFGKEGSSVLVATYFEAKFIEAEAAFQSGDISRAATAHNEAVRASITKMIGSGTSSVVDLGTQEDGSSTSSEEYMVDVYIASYGSETESTISLEKIMVEKYKAMFTQGIESWVDVRRHDYQYPSYLTIPVDKDGDDVASEFIRRVLYPQDEINFNSANVPQVTVFERLWWDNSN